MRTGASSATGMHDTPRSLLELLPERTYRFELDFSARVLREARRNNGPAAARRDGYQSSGPTPRAVRRARRLQISSSRNFSGSGIRENSDQL